MQVTKEKKYDGCRCNIIAPAMIVLVFNKAYFERVDGRKRRIRGESVSPVDRDIIENVRGIRGKI